MTTPQHPALRWLSVASWAILVACIARLWVAPLFSSFWVDEMVTAFVVRYPGHPSFAPVPQVPASIYYWLPRFTSHLLGESEFAYRIPPGPVPQWGWHCFLIGAYRRASDSSQRRLVCDFRLPRTPRHQLLRGGCASIWPGHLHRLTVGLARDSLARHGAVDGRPRVRCRRRISLANSFNLLAVLSLFLSSMPPSACYGKRPGPAGGKRLVSLVS